MKMLIKIELVSQDTKLIYVTDKAMLRQEIYNILTDLKAMFFAGASPVRTSVEIKVTCHGEEED